MQGTSLGAGVPGARAWHGDDAHHRVTDLLTCGGQAGRPWRCRAGVLASAPAFSEALGNGSISGLLEHPWLVEHGLFRGIQSQRREHPEPRRSLTSVWERS